jgi:hypothetical protein
MQRPLNIPLSPCLLVALSLLLALTGCEFTPTTAVSALSPQAQLVKQSLELWPEIPAGSSGLKRPFFATIHLAGRRTTVSGILDYHNPRDFRLTAITEMGIVLFDARMNWAGVTVLRQMPGLDKSIVATLVTDLSRAFQLPASLDGLSEKGGQLLLRRTESDTYRYNWLFDPRSGRLRETDVDMGAFDALRIQYLRYNSRGWPEELTVTRKARFYDVGFTFTDDNFVQHDRHENVQ